MAAISAPSGESRLRTIAVNRADGCFVFCCVLYDGNTSELLAEAFVGVV